jgi:hypothetical protein
VVFHRDDGDLPSDQLGDEFLVNRLGESGVPDADVKIGGAGEIGSGLVGRDRAGSKCEHRDVGRG